MGFAGMPFVCAGACMRKVRPVIVAEAVSTERVSGGVSQERLVVSTHARSIRANNLHPQPLLNHVDYNAARATCGCASLVLPAKAAARLYGVGNTRGNFTRIPSAASLAGGAHAQENASSADEARARALSDDNRARISRILTPNAKYKSRGVSGAHCETP
jgi:hypothetical protein